MRILMLVVLILISPNSPIAQTADDISWGAEYVSKSANGKDYKREGFLGATDKHYYVHVSENTRKSKERLLKYNYDNVLLQEIDLDVTRNRKPIKRFKMVQTSSGDYIIGISINRRKKIFHHYYYEIGNGNPKEMKLLFSSPMYKFRVANGFIDNDDYAGVVVSQDSNYVVFTNVIGTSKIQKNNFQELVKLKVFNSTMELQWQKIVRLPFDDEKFFITDVNISNDGTVRLLAKKELKKAKDKKLQFSSKYDTFLYRITKEKDHERIKVESKNGYIFNPKLVTLGEGTDFIFGTYHLPEKKPTEEHGFFLNKYNIDGKKEFAKIYPWNEEVYKEIEHKKNNGFAFTEKIIVQDNSLTFITQQKYGGELNYSSTLFNGDWNWNYKLNSIIIPSISFDGELKWTKLIKRYFAGEVATGKKINSPTSLLKNDKIYLVFDISTSNKNSQTKGENLISSVTESHYTKLVGINKEGVIELDQTIHESNLDSRFKIYSKNAQALSNGRILFRKSRKGHSNTNYSFGILNLE